MRGWLVAGALSIICSAACSGDGAEAACGEDGCPGDGGLADAIAPDASGGTAPCGSTDLLVEDFESPDPDQHRWIPFNFGPGLPPVIEDGRAVLAFDDDGQSGAPGFIAARDYRFDESQVAVDAAGVIDLAEVQTRVYLAYPFDGNLGFRVSAGQLEAVAKDPGAAEERILDAVPFSPADHRFWRLREAGDTAHLETSPDGEAWSLLAAISSRRFARPATLFFLLVESATAAGTISIEGINQVGDLAATGWCPIDLLADDFDDPEVAEIWKPATAGGCTVAEVDGLLEMVNPTLGGACSYASALGSILTDGAVEVDVAGDGDGAPDQVFAVQLGVGGDTIAFVHAAGGTRGRLRLERLEPGERPGASGAEVLDDVAFDPAAHRTWRFRHQDGELHAETSPDGATWLDHAALADLAVADVFVRLETTRAGLGAVAFDELRPTPPAR
jgi:hypothetical protein